MAADFVHLVTTGSPRPAVDGFTRALKDLLPQQKTR